MAKTQQGSTKGVAPETIPTIRRKLLPFAVVGSAIAVTERMLAKMADSALRFLVSAAFDPVRCFFALGSVAGQIGAGDHPLELANWKSLSSNVACAANTSSSDVLWSGELRFSKATNKSLPACAASTTAATNTSNNNELGMLAAGGFAVDCSRQSPVASGGGSLL
jgi:hypothetical protein